MTELSVKFNADETRCVSGAIFGFACYAGGPVDDRVAWEGSHVGILGNAVDALDWLETGSPTPRRVYPIASAEAAE